jgi:transcriptional regulator with XRE-family HTH domain
MTENELRKVLGQKAKDLRKRAKLTQQQVAEKIGVYREDLSAFERRGEKIGSLEKINSIFDCLGYQLDISEKNYVDTAYCPDREGLEVTTRSMSFPCLPTIS